MATVKNEKSRVALSSVLAGAFLTITKLVVGLMTGSIGIISEAAHSFLDWAAAIMTYFAVKIGDRPADESHPYGHGKVESVSALIETGLLFVTSGWIIFEAGRRLLHGGSHVEATWYAFAVVIMSIVIDISRARALSRVAKATGSQALEADALHFSSDIYSSAIVLLGLVCVRFGITGADAAAAVAVAVFVIVAGYRLGKRTIDVLVDKAPDGMIENVRDLAAAVPGVVRVGLVRARPLGPNMAVEVGILVGRNLSAQQTQVICQAIGTAIRRDTPEAEVTVHAEPIRLDSETIIEQVQSLAAKHGLAVHKIVADRLDGRQYISYDVEMPDDLALQAAHDRATALEDDIRVEFGGDAELISHIEPLRHQSILSSNIDEEELRSILSIIGQIDEEIEGLDDLHNVLVRNVNGKHLISFHCYAHGAISLEHAHELTNLFEQRLKLKIPTIKRVIIHVEPR